MMLTEHSLVVLDVAPQDSKLARGDVGTIVHVYKNGRAFEVEFVDGGGSTISLITVNAEDVRQIQPGEMLHTRSTHPENK